MDIRQGKISPQDQLAGAITQYFHAYFDGLHRYAFTLLKDNDEAKDAVQAVFLRLWENSKILDEQQSVKAYLYTAVYNYCLNIKRHERIREKYAASGNRALYEPGTDLAGKETSDRIMFHINNLPPQCKLIFNKSRFEGKKYAEIAAEMGLSVKTVEVQIGKALRILREKLAALIVAWIIYNIF